jgi:transcriptional regulator with XRE-family HTH domain
VTTPEQRKAFGEALQQALDDAHMSGRGLARSLGLSPTAVSKWLRGRTTPAPETVARAESLLRVSPGVLSSPLGYVTLEASAGRQPSSVAEAVKADPRLGPREQAVLLTVYRELVQQYAAARAEPTEPTS